MRSRSVRGAPRERWMVSYADFTTLLFALFVVLFATSQTDRSKAKRVSQAVSAALHSPRGKGAELEETFQALVKGLDEEIRSGKMQVRMEDRGLVVSLNETPFFPSGEDALSPSTFGSLATVANAICALPNPVRMEGHTDAQPIHTPRFRNNWELSAARAIAVMEVLRDRWGIPAKRLAISGYADSAPLDTNETESGRARNRRVDIVVFNAAARD